MSSLDGLTKIENSPCIVEFSPELCCICFSCSHLSRFGDGGLKISSLGDDNGELSFGLFLFRLSPCEGLCFSFSLHRSPSESEESLSDDSLEDEEDEDEEAEEEESDWTPVGSSICTLSAISAISGLSFFSFLYHFLESFGLPLTVLCQTTLKLTGEQKFCVTAIVVSKFTTTCHQPPGMKTVSPGQWRISSGLYSSGQDGNCVLG